MIPSPCIGVCKLDPKTQLCKGCFRNITEITEWYKFDDNKKTKVLEKIVKRKSAQHYFYFMINIRNRGFLI